MRRQKVLGSYQCLDVHFDPFLPLLCLRVASNADYAFLKCSFVNFVEVGIYCSFNLSPSLLAKCIIKITVFDVDLGGLQHQSLTSKYRVKVQPEVLHNTGFPGFQCSPHWSVIYNTNNYTSFGNLEQNLIRRRPILANFNISKSVFPSHSSYFWQDLKLLMKKRRFAILSNLQSISNLALFS